MYGPRCTDHFAGPRPAITRCTHHGTRDAGRDLLYCTRARVPRPVRSADVAGSATGRKTNGTARNSPLCQPRAVHAREHSGTSDPRARPAGRRVRSRVRRTRRCPRTPDPHPRARLPTDVRALSGLCADRPRTAPRGRHHAPPTRDELRSTRADASLPPPTRDSSTARHLPVTERTC